MTYDCGHLTLWGRAEWKCRDYREAFLADHQAVHVPRQRLDRREDMFNIANLAAEDLNH